MNYVKSKKIGVLFIKSIMSLVVFMISIMTYSLSTGEPYQVVALLPFSYMIINSFYGVQLRKYGRYKGGFIYKTALIVIFVRYVITPLSIVLTGEFYRPGIFTSKESINLAVLIMIFELISVYLTLYIAQRYYSKKNLILIENELKPLSHKFVLILFLLLAIPIVLIIDPNLLLPTNFLIVNENYEKVQLEMSFDGIYSTLASLIKPIFFLIILSIFREQYDKSSRKIFIYLSFILVILFMGFYTGTKRWEIVFSGIIGLYLMKKIYINTPKIMNILVTIIMVSSFISASLYKFSWAIQNSTSPIKDIFVEMFSMFQDYFGGPRVVANSIEMANKYGESIGLYTFINDFIGSIPVISGFVNQSDRINVYFNMYHNIPGNNLITPMIGIGYSYFIIFPPLFSVICYWLLVKVDYKLAISKSIEYKYLYLYIGLYLSMSMGFNTQIIFSKFLIPFLVLIILFKINDYIYLKKAPIKFVSSPNSVVFTQFQK
jgi:hypothetical protein